ncbi:hypothetical protein Anas_10903 [Armadillidium nasatum]|uniref:Uncharacterized protein n=1 Tax=Armadillidium nasatum TaxID=96803 RepID=A0A5N5TAP9_9CRUS|nr:hypothetical protein Anas_10903 [Armadillidium nasatum]
MDPLQLHQLDKIDSKDSFGNAFVDVKENTSGGTRQLNESFTSGSCTLLEDIDTPSSFNSSTICVEKILSISDESSQDSKDKIVETNEVSVNDFSPRTLLGNDTSYLLKESEKVLEALKGNKTISCKKQGSPISKLNILDLDNLNDSLLADFTQFMCKENELQDQDGPSMSTPKNFDKSCISNLTVDCKKNPLRNEEKWDVTLETEKSKKGNQKVINTTYDKETSKAIKEPVMNVTFETGSPKKTEEPLNKTFEVVGNGSFIIDGQCTTLMDMESNALNTVLGSASNTPVSRGIKSYPDVKKLDKSTLKKRLSLINYQLKEDLTSTITERSSQASTAGSREESDEKSLPSSKVDSQNILSIEKTNENQEGNSGEKEERLPSLPSFGSVSSIGTDGINSKDICIDDFMGTPEVFRHRNKSLAAHVTSTPTVMTSDIKFDTDLGLGSVPTPILAPKASSLIKSFKTEKNINNSYVCEAKKERLDIDAKGRLSFATSSEGGSPDSLREDNKSEDKVINVINKEGVSVSLDTSKNKTTIKGKNYDQISKLETSDTAVENLETDICQIPVKESGLSSSSHSAANKDLKDIECGTVLTSTAKEGIEVQKNGFSNYINEAERKFEPLDNVPDKVCSENDHISAVKDCSLEFTDCAIALSNSDRINSVKDPDIIILPNANEMIAAYEKLCEDEIHNFTNEIKCEASTTEKSEKNQKCQSDAGKAGNTINKTLKSKEIVKSTSRASLSKFPNSVNKALNPSSKVLSKPLSSSNRLSHQPSTKVERKPTPSVTKSANSRLSTPRFSGSQPLRPSVKPLNTTEKNSSVKKEVPLSKQDTQTKMKLQLPRPALKPLNTRTLPNPKIEKKLPNSVSNRPKLTPNSRTTPTPTPNSRTTPTPTPNSRTTPTPTPKTENIQQKTVPNQSKIPSNKRSSLPTSRFTFSSSNKENDSVKSHVPKKTFIGSGIRPPSTKTCIPLPRTVSNR